MAEFFASGTAIECIVALLCAEAATLAILRRLAHVEIAYVDIVASLGAGAALLMALQSAVRGKPWQWMALWLTLAFVLHILDLSRRLLGRTARQPLTD